MGESEMHERGITSNMIGFSAAISACENSIKQQEVGAGTVSQRGHLRLWKSRKWAQAL